jgi:hypothetical protein
MSERKVVDLEEYRNKQTAPTDNEPQEQQGVWEMTSLPLLPARDGAPAGEETVRIVKVSSGFGKLRIPAWEEDTVRCMAA